MRYIRVRAAHSDTVEMSQSWHYIYPGLLLSCRNASMKWKKIIFPICHYNRRLLSKGLVADQRTLDRVRLSVSEKQ